MGLKTAFLVVILIALAFFLLTTESGKRYLAFISSKIREQLREAVPITPVGKVYINLSIPHGYLEKRAFSIRNSTFVGYGVMKEIFYERAKISKKGEVSIRIEIAEGKLTFTENNTIRIFALATRFELDDFKIIPEKAVDISIFDMQPTNFTLSNIIEADLVLTDIGGQIQGAKALIKLEKGKVELQQLLGNLTYINQTASLSGNVTKVLINGNDITNII